MSVIKEAADRLVKKGTLTKVEYDALERAGIFKEAAGGISSLGAIASNFPKDFIQKWIVPAGAVAGLALAGRELIVDPVVSARKISKSFNQMTDKVPQLAGTDPQRMRDYFDVVKTFSPRSASNPLVAGALVHKMMEFGGVDHKLVQDLASIEAKGDSTVPMTSKLIETALSSAMKINAKKDA